MQPTRAAVAEWISQYLVNELQLPREAIAFDKPFTDYGLDSLEQAVMVGVMEDAFAIEVDVKDAFDTPTIDGVLGALVKAGVVQDA
ncbi:MAG: hypothetical protein DI565_19515 [Ancylobacter novellus]|uniref:Carrier domain-containing protein n=1 Tax=Ancylobacter novellus TaxID=921 RepID=A0A2W5K4E0_ANCNO|nr:MAG: hypothetical protein DI565_19515 [Ancylobacter novellus]